MSRARDLASNVTALDALASDATALGALADIQAMLTARGVGAVSEVDGVPTGAFMWSENVEPNGTYIRFADGTQICWGGVTSSSAGHVTWTFPAAFISPPRFQGTALASANGRIVVYSNMTETACQVGVYGTSNTALDGIFASTMAVGRWY